MSGAVLLRPALGWLDAAVVAGTLITAGVCIVTAPSSALVVPACLGAGLVAWFAFGRRAENGGPGWAPFLGLVAVISLIGAVATPSFATFQVVALPLAWMLTPGFRSALVVNTVIVLAIGIGYARVTGVLEAAAVEGLSFGFSVAMGAWITRITHTSEGRRELVEQLTAAQETIAALNRDAGTVTERGRLARELHDTLAQSLAGVVMLAERARARHPGDAALEVLEDAARQALSEARGLVTAGANVPLEGGLAAALETLAQRFRRETGLEVAVDVRAEVPRGLEVVLLRCAQEGLANVRKHAGARRVAVRVRDESGAALLEVEDDGGGPGAGSGFGIAGMRDRLALVGGAVDLVARAGGGSALRVRVPAAERVAP